MRARPLSNVLIFFRCAVRVVRGFERSGSRVDHVLWVTPIKKGKTDVVRRYMDALENSRRQEYERSQEELGMHKEIFWILPARDEDENDQLVLYMEADSMEQAFRDWAASEGEFETFGKAQWAGFTEELPAPLCQGP